MGLKGIANFSFISEIGSQGDGGSSGESSSIDPNNMGTDLVLSNDNKTVTKVNTANRSYRATPVIPADGKFYWEIAIDGDKAHHGVGVVTSDQTVWSTHLRGTNYAWVINTNDGERFHNDGGAAYGDEYPGATGIIGIAMNTGTGEIWWSVDGDWGNSGDPGTYYNRAYASVTGSLYPAGTIYAGGDAHTIRSLASEFTYDIPQGFQALGATKEDYQISDVSFNDSQDNTSYLGRAFDGKIPAGSSIVNGTWGPHIGTNAKPAGYCGQDFGVGNAKVIKAYRVCNLGQERAACAWSLRASNTGEFQGEETVLHWVTDQGFPFTNSWISVNLTNATAYRYYRLYVTDSVYGNTYNNIQELELFETAFSSLGNELGDLAFPHFSIGNQNQIGTGFSRVLDDGNGTGSWYAYDSGFLTAGWVGQDFGSGETRIITKYGLYCVAADHNPKDWTLEASASGIWGGEEVTLDTQTAQQWATDGWKEYEISNTTAYRYYRLNVTANDGNVTYLIIREIALYGEVRNGVINPTNTPVHIVDNETDISATVNSRFNAGGSTDWSALLEIGDRITVSGFANAGNNGVFWVNQNPTSAYCYVTPVDDLVTEAVGENVDVWKEVLS